MADRNLTFEDFKRLSPEERNRRYEELSDQDKFLARCSQPSGVHGVLFTINQRLSHQDRTLER